MATRPTERLSMALLRMRIVRALADMREACALLDFDGAVRAEQAMNEGLDILACRLRVG